MGNGQKSFIKLVESLYEKDEVSKNALLNIMDLRPIKKSSGEVTFSSAKKIFEEFEESKEHLQLINHVSHVLLDAFTVYLKRCVEVTLYREAFNKYHKLTNSDFLHGKTYDGFKHIDSRAPFPRGSVANNFIVPRFCERTFTPATIHIIDTEDKRIQYLGKYDFMLGDTIIRSLYEEDKKTERGMYRYVNNTVGTISREYDMIKPYTDKSYFEGKNVEWYNENDIYSAFQVFSKNASIMYSSDFIDSLESTEVLIECVSKCMNEFLSETYPHKVFSSTNVKQFIHNTISASNIQDQLLKDTILFLQGIVQQGPLVNLVTQIIEFAGIYKHEKRKDIILVKEDGFEKGNIQKDLSAYRVPDIVLEGISVSERTMLLSYLNQYFDDEMLGYLHGIDDLFTILEEGFPSVYTGNFKHDTLGRRFALLGETIDLFNEPYIRNRCLQIMNEQEFDALYNLVEHYKSMYFFGYFFNSSKNKESLIYSIRGNNVTYLDQKDIEISGETSPWYRMKIIGGNHDYSVALVNFAYNVFFFDASYSFDYPVTSTDELSLTGIRNEVTFDHSAYLKSFNNYFDQDEMEIALQNSCGNIYIYELIKQVLNDMNIGGTLDDETIRREVALMDSEASIEEKIDYDFDHVRELIVDILCSLRVGIETSETHSVCVDLSLLENING